MVADMGFYGLGKGEASGNAPFIVHCVNTHDKLVGRLRRIERISASKVVLKLGGCRVRK